MTKTRRQNPQHSTIVQLCLDAAAAASPDVAHLANQLLDALEAHPDDVQRIDKRFAYHQYPADTIRFVMIPTINALPAKYYDLSPTARDLMHLLLRSCQRGNVVQAKNDTLANALSISVRTLIRAKNELISAGYLTIMQQAHAQTPDTMRVSASCVASGRRHLVHDGDGDDPPLLSVRLSHTADDGWINMIEEAGSQCKNRC